MSDNKEKQTIDGLPEDGDGFAPDEDGGGNSAPGESEEDGGSSAPDGEDDSGFAPDGEDDGNYTPGESKEDGGGPSAPDSEDGGGLPAETARSAYRVPGMGDGGHLLSGMYQSWFLDYASYVILERAVPHINDGLKPVQRRILHSMKILDDGRYSKVANIVGHTMQFHPHGDASIGDALVQLGQKDLLVDCQGNWGNILTGDGAAAPRYIEARLSKFALDVVFNPKTTVWKLSYDGRNREPVSLPVKFPLLLAQGAEGIAVGLSSKILPHNFNEILDAAIAHLRGEPFVLYPDFQTGGSIDVSRYNDGERGGVVKVRAKIGKLDSRTLVITEIPYGRNTSTLIDSILRANDKGKIKIKKIDDNTAREAEILVHLAPGVSSDKTIDALYAFTDCEISISPNCCVIEEHNPRFLTVSDVLRHSAGQTLALLRGELEIHRAEQEEQLFYASLERIFIVERIYKDPGFENATSMEIAVQHIDGRLEPFKPDFIRAVTRDDIMRLMEIKMGRILRFNIDSNNELIARIKAEMERIDAHLAHIVDYTVDWFATLKEKYGAAWPRHTELRNFDTIVATKVIEANEKLYINREEGFIGTALKRDEYVCNCSEIDDVILFYKNGTYRIIRVSDKIFVGRDILYLNVFKRNDTRTIYNAIYRDGATRRNFIKRFAVTGITRDREYDVTQGTPDSAILYFSANPNGEAETVKIVLRPRLRQKVMTFEKNFSEIMIKGRSSMGNVLTKAEIYRISLRQKGTSTLGGRQVWFDRDVLRLNCDGRGDALGEFHGDDQILVVLRNGEFYTTSYDLSNHYEDSILRMERFDANKVWTAVLHDADQRFPYLKRFRMETASRRQNLLGENGSNSLYLLSDHAYPRVEVVFGGNDAFRAPLVIDAESFIGIKSFKARGKRLTTFEVDRITELEPVRFAGETADGGDTDNGGGQDGDGRQDDGQMNLFK
ncbi:MAG: DNA gyrase/topoisomerase IV subunit A [Tannerella sp.]|jgi:topoisomerase-4 subunit A|nr:DNA gyrase/topoisomerase IV subunit A [Tannerella sp.]